MKTKPTNYERATMKTLFKIIGILASTLPAVIATSPCYAGKIAVTISGREAIFLAGSYDVAIPSLGQPFFLLERHDFVGLDFLKERFPTGVVVKSGTIVRVLKQAQGEVNFFDGDITTPEGSGSTISITAPTGGISSYFGPAGALVGVFLGNADPATLSPPEALDFGNSPESRDFTSLPPALGQIFFIGDGIRSTGALQKFIAPFGATRLFLGVPDGLGSGLPGAYEDNKGAYRIVISVAP